MNGSAHNERAWIRTTTTTTNICNTIKSKLTIIKFTRLYVSLAVIIYFYSAPSLLIYILSLINMKVMPVPFIRQLWIHIQSTAIQRSCESCSQQSIQSTRHTRQKPRETHKKKKKIIITNCETSLPRVAEEINNQRKFRFKWSNYTVMIRSVPTPVWCTNVHGAHQLLSVIIRVYAVDVWHKRKLKRNRQTFCVLITKFTIHFCVLWTNHRFLSDGFEMKNRECNSESGSKYFLKV